MLLLLRMYIKMYEYDNSKSAATYVLLLSPDYLRRCVISIISYTIRKRSKKNKFWNPNSMFQRIRKEYDEKRIKSKEKKIFDWDGIRTHAGKAHWISSPTP